MTKLRARAVLCDLDGTLVDSFDAIHESYNVAFGALGYAPLPRADLKFVVGPPLLDTFAERTRPDLAERGVAIYRAHYVKVFIAKSRPYPDVVPTLEALRARGIRFAVGTNKKGDVSRALLAGLGLDAYFERIVGEGDGPANKPSPEMIEHLVASLGVEGDDAIYVGDTPGDLRAARAAEVRAVAVTTGWYSADELRVEEPARIVDRFSALMDLVL